MENPDPIDIDLQPGHLIRRLHQIAVGIFLQEGGELNVTPVQYAALQVVCNQPGIDQRTLARAIALDASTTGGVVDRLEVRGWMERRQSPEDRRARQLFLTPAGLQGLTDIERLCEVESEGVSGVICGRAIYSGDLDFVEAQRLADRIGAD